MVNNIKTTYTCPMHPEIKQDKPGRCPKCGMNLVPLENKKDQSHEHHMEILKDGNYINPQDILPNIKDYPNPNQNQNQNPIGGR